LTRTAWEAQLLADAAVKYKVATQMGNPGWNHEGTKPDPEHHQDSAGPSSHF
jgi:hypothetical protein